MVGRRRPEQLASEKKEKKVKKEQDTSVPAVTSLRRDDVRRGYKERGAYYITERPGDGRIVDICGKCCQRQPREKADEKRETNRK